MQPTAQEIYPGLWQGGWPPPGDWLNRRGFSTLVLCAVEYQPPTVVPPQVANIVGLRARDPWPGIEVVYAPNDDDIFTPPPREVLHDALRAARIVATRLAQKRKVLVTCWQGKNRSGLVSAMALFLHLGISGQEATRIVQRKRAGALRNPVFVSLLANLRQDHFGEAVVADPPATEAGL